MVNDADLKELREEFAHDTGEWKDIRTEGTKDMRYVAGDPWEPRDRELREANGRFCLSLDELSQYTNQVVNEVRANKRAVKFAPVGNGANDESAKFYADKMREIEYRSRAQIAYTTAFENAVQRSYGFFRVSTRYESSRSVNQDIWIDPIANPDLVTPDPYALMPDMSDQKHCWVREPWSVSDFERKWPKAKVRDYTTELMQAAPQWLDSSRVFVGEHWKILTKKRKLLIVQPTGVRPPSSTMGLRDAVQNDPIGIFEDELDGQALPGTLLATRDVDDQTVRQQLTNGLEILEETAWPGKYIPIVACLGKVIYVDEGAGTKRKILSMVRLARDPFMAYCFYRTCEMENVGMTTKNPYWAYEGQLTADQMNLIAKSMHEPVAVLLAKATTAATGLAVLPLPQRNVSEVAIQALSIGAEEMRRAIQSAMGQSPLPTSAQRRNDKSGVALKHIEESGQRGSFHFTDHYLDMVTQGGIVVEDLMDKILDTARDTGVRKANDTAEIIRINDPSRKSVSTKGDHLVTVSTGPSFESERDAASDFADTLATSSPELFALLGPLIVKLKNLGPIGDEMIELLETIQPPQVQQLRESKAQQDDPQQAAKMLVQAKAQLEQLSQQASQMKQALDTDAAKQQATIAKAHLDGQTQLLLQKMKDATAIAVAKINALTKGVIADNEAQMEAIAIDATQQHEALQADLDRQHELGMATVGHEQGMEAADQQQAGAADLAAQGHQQNMEAVAAQPEAGA